MFDFLKKHYRLRYHSKYRHAKKLFAFDIGLLILAIALLIIATVLLFWKPSIMDKIDLWVTFDNANLKSGENACLLISYKNHNNIKLLNPTLNVNWPENFYITNEEIGYGHHWTKKLETIDPLKNEEFKICGKVWGQTKNDQIFSASLSYQPEKTNYSEQKNSLFKINLNDSAVKVEMQIPETSLPTNNINTVITVKNNNTEKIENLYLKSENEFVFPTSSQNFTILPLESKSFNVILKTPNIIGKLNVKINLVKNIENIALNQNEDQKTIIINAPDIAIKANFDNNIYYADNSMELPLHIWWKNQSNSNLYNLNIALNIDPKIVDLNATARLNNLKIENGRLIITSKNRTALSSSRANDEDAFDLKIKLLSHFNLQKSENLFLTIVPAILIKDETNEQSFEKQGDGAKLPIASEINFSVDLRYYTEEGDQLGRGPLPPQTGETTKYWVLAQIKNSTNNLKNPIFNAELGDNVEFTGRQSVSIGPSLIQKEGKITWNYKELPANSQTGLYFEVAVTPKDNQIGKTLALIKKINFSATDAWVNKKFDFTLSEIKNILPKNDLGAKNGAEVIK